MLLDGYVLGFLATASFVAGVFFLRFWWRTRDFLFIAFATVFLFQTIASTSLVFTGDPNRLRPWMYAVQIATYLLILLAILAKNRRAR